MPKNDIIDASAANQIHLRRYITGQVAKVLSLFESFDAKLAKLLRNHIRIGMEIGSQAYTDMVRAITGLRSDLMSSLLDESRSTSSDLAPIEHNREWDVLTAAAVGFGRRPKRSTISDILAIPFASGASSAATMVEWIKQLKIADMRRITDALTLGLVNQDTKDTLLARIIGTSKNSFRDGVVAVSRHNARALTTTLLTHVSRAAREFLWRLTPGVVGAMWSSILDEKTSLICLSRNGHVVMFGRNKPPNGAILLSPPGARPPAHPHCRSMMTALRKGPLPTRRSTFDWLSSQPSAFQDDLLGVARGEMFRRGSVTLSGFVDQSGKTITLDQLAET